jgi:predicted ATP-dependent endonuclease of OLD family
LDKIDIQDKGVIEGIRAYPFNTTKAFKNLQENDKTYVKMLLKIDDYISKVFFAKNVLIVEGDTEDIVLRETIKRMPDNVRKDVQSNWQIIKARGKAAIISLVKYLKCMGIEPMVIHDEDDEVENAKKFNQPILDALNNPKNRFMLHNCIEDVLGYKAPSNEKPYHAFKYVNDNWGNDWESICNEKWKELMEKIFEQSFEHIKKETLNMVASDTEE